METFGEITGASVGQSVGAHLRSAVERLASAGLDSPRLDAEVLLADCLGLSRAQLLVAGDLPMDSQRARRFGSLVARRLQREPVAYLIGKQEFWSLDFTVTPEVLIPRPDSERLVEVGLRCAAQISSTSALKIADLCTGSGALAVSLATELPSAQFFATDVSPAALQIARANAVAHQVAQRVQYFAGDLFDALASCADLRFDLMVSNPPYVRRADIATLAPEVSRWEPPLALDGGVDGLDFYRRIFDSAPDYLAGHGRLLLEIGADMAGQVSAICAATGRYREVDIVQDYAGKDRVVVARLRTA